MAGIKRTKYNDATLKEISKKLEMTQKIIADTMSGKSMMDGINEHHLNIHQFRRVLEVTHTMQTELVSKSMPQRLDRDFICSPIEALYGDIFGIHEDAWEDYTIPEDAEESYRYVSKDLTDKERTILEEYYFNEKTLEEVGKQFEVTRDRIRQINVKALRKLRHPSRINILSIGITEYNRKREILKEQARIEEEEMQKAFRERLNAKIEKVTDIQATFNDLLDVDIENMELSVRAFNCLRRSSHNTLRDIIKEGIHGMMTIRNLGRKSMTEVLVVTYNTFINAGIPLENVFAMRRELIGLKIKDEKYEKFIETILKGGCPSYEEYF